MQLKIENQAIKWDKKIYDSMGAKNVIVTGIVSGNIVRDYIFGESEFSVQYKKIPTENHGGGCTFSSALTGYIAAGNSFEKSTRMAGSFAQKFIKNSRKIGKGVAIAGSKRDNLTKDETCRCSIRVCKHEKCIKVHT